MWWPRNPEPPITRTVPNSGDGVDGGRPSSLDERGSDSGLGTVGAGAGESCIVAL